MSLNWFIPAPVKSRVGSSSGTSEALGQTVWPRLRKKSRYVARICADVAEVARVMAASHPAERKGRDI
jgi:hypothetical protein